MSAGYVALAKARSLVAIRRWRDAMDVLTPAMTTEATAAEAHCLRAQCIASQEQVDVGQARDYLAALSTGERAALEDKGHRQAARYQAAATSVLGTGDTPGVEIFTTAARHQQRFAEMASAELARRSTPTAVRSSAPGRPGAARPQVMMTAPSGSPRSSMSHRHGVGFPGHGPEPAQEPEHG